jgi:P-type Cu2+ transporter
VDGCGHCGLPLGRRPVVVEVDGARIRCCCYGCVLAWQVTRAGGESGAAASIFVRLGLGVFFAVNVMMVGMPAYVPYVYGTEAGPVDGPLFQMLRVLAAVLTMPVLMLLGWPILASAWAGLRGGAANTDALIVLGTVAAYALSVANTIAGRPAVYFDTAAMLLVLVTVGRWLEASAKAEAGAAVRARLSPMPAVARREQADGREATVDAEALAPGDVVCVGPGSAVPADGVVLSGEGGIDEATLTGETWPVVKRPGDAIAGGTCSIDGVFRIRVARPARESAAARIGDLLATALRDRAPWERTADRAARVLVPLVVVLAIGAAAAWTWRVDVEHGVLVGLAVLVVACPCGLGIATPVAVWTGLATASRHGVIVRNAPALERAAALGGVVFDKTGTLTSRTPLLIDVRTRDGAAMADPERGAVLARAAALARAVDHPLGRAIVAAVPAGRSDGVVVTDVRSRPGRGVTGRVDGRGVAIGNRRLALELLGAAAGASAHEREVDSGPQAWVVEDGRLIAVLLFAEAARAEAASAVTALRRLGVRPFLATGDARAVAVVPDLIPAADARCGLLPADKLARVGELRRDTGAIAMVGDGVIDAPALAGADLGIAIGSATDLIRTTADVAILSDDLGRVPWLIAHARRVGRVARQNLVWAFGYNAIAIVLAAAGQLGPLVAAAAMIASSLAVVVNARRLRTFDHEGAHAARHRGRDAVSTARTVSIARTL